MFDDEPWCRPGLYREGAPTAMCAGCSRVVLAEVRVRGYCRECVGRLGVKLVAEAPADPQLSLGL
jgi:hypothetical protein